MTCKDFEKLIPSFIEEKLDLGVLRMFGEHLESCEECREELGIQFLVTEGMLHLEEGDAFDLQNELAVRLEHAKSRVKFHTVFLRICTVVQMVAVALIAGAVAWIIL